MIRNLGTYRHISELPSTLFHGLRPYYIHPSVRCPVCLRGSMHVDYGYDERLLVCDHCCNFAVVERIGRLGTREQW